MRTSSRHVESKGAGGGRCPEAITLINTKFKSRQKQSDIINIISASGRGREGGRPDQLRGDAGSLNRVAANPCPTLYRARPSRWRFTG
jgi:hypothetical protein